MFEKFKDLWKGFINMFTSRSIKQLKVDKHDLTETYLQRLDLWNNMYEGFAPWCGDYVKSLGIEKGICREFANVAVSELSVAITNDKLQEIYNDKVNGLFEEMQLGLALGSFIMRPVGKDGVEYISADKFIPISFDSGGSLTDCILLEQKQVGNSIYTRAERHSITSGMLRITNEVYKSQSTAEVGVECGLSAVEEWASLLEEIVYPNMQQMDLGYYKNPLKNRIASKHLGVSIYDSAVDRIEKADTQGARLDWEYESGERAVHIDSRALSTSGVAKLNKRLYRGLNLDAGENKELFQEYSPSFRDTNIMQGLNEYYRQIEFAVGLAFGDLSDYQTVEKTATEIKAAKMRKYNQVNAIQGNLKRCLLGFIDALAFYNEMYTSGYEVAINFKDSILTDEVAERQNDKEEMALGIMSAAEYRMKWYGEDEETAKANLPDQTITAVLE